MSKIPSEPVLLKGSKFSSYNVKRNRRNRRKEVQKERKEHYSLLYTCFGNATFFITL